jgi:drug/metabolite transporter (DMT)-like permease
MILAALVLGERLTLVQGIGGVLALAGVALVRKG